MNRYLTAISLLMFTAWPAWADQHGHMSDNSHNAQFQNQKLDVEMWLGRLENPDRDVIKHRDHVIAALNLKLGQSIADIGAGTGAYMVPIAKAVGDSGRYFGVDIAPDFHGFMRTRAEEADLNNVTLVVNRIDSATLPTASVDTMLVVDTYHHFEPAEPMLRSMYDAIRPGGTLVIVDFDRIEGQSREWIIENVRADKLSFREEIEASGFKFVEEVKDTGLTENFFFRFQRPM